MGPRVRRRLLLLLLGCWALRACGAAGRSPTAPSPSPRRPELRLLEGPWVAVGTPLRLQCFGPGPEFLLLLNGNRSMAAVTASHFAIFDPVLAAADSGAYTCRCPPGPPSNAVAVAVTDPCLPPPELSLTPLPQPLPLPGGSEASLLCRGPPGAVAFHLYRGGPGGAVGRRGAEGGSARFPLGPLGPRHEGAYVCTYSDRGGGVSAPSPPLLLLVEEGDATPTKPDWKGCDHWVGGY